MFQEPSVHEYREEQSSGEVEDKYERPPALGSKRDIKALLGIPSIAKASVYFLC